MANAEERLEDISTHEILRRIQEGSLDPSCIKSKKNIRQPCVLTLLYEGYTQAAMAKLFKVSDKTIARDFDEIFEALGSTLSPENARKLMAEYAAKTMAHHSYLMRLARQKEASIAEKIAAEAAAFKVIDQYMSRFQTMGLLPLLPHKYFDINFDKPKELVSDTGKSKKGTSNDRLSKLSPQQVEQLIKIRERAEYQINQKLEEFEKESSKQSDTGI